MEAVKRATMWAGMLTLVAVLAAACGGPPTVQTAVGQRETIAAAAQAAGPGVSDATRTAAYCAIERTAITALEPFRRADNPPHVWSLVKEAAPVAVTVAEVAPREIADALRTQRAVLNQLHRVIEQGTYDVMAYRRPSHYKTRPDSFLDAVAAIARFDREVCGIG